MKVTKSGNQILVEFEVHDSESYREFVLVLLDALQQGAEILKYELN
jgi:hypothetical protein